MGDEVSGDVKYPDVHVQLTGEDGNVFFIMGRIGTALRRANVPQEEIDKFYEEAKSSDYDNALQTVMKWVETS